LPRTAFTPLMGFVAVLLFTGGVSGGALSSARAAESAGAIGQIVPAGGLISLIGTPGAFVDEVRVAVGDSVRAGAVLMTLTGETVTAEHEIAAAELETARTLSAAQIAAQNLSVQIAQERLADASRQVASYRSVGPQSTSANELARLEGAENQARLALQIEQARARGATADGARLVGTAEKRLALAAAAMELRAPADGTILRVDRRVGQLLTGEPAIHMGDVTTMYVVSQVYEGDLLRIRPGMSATIRSATLSEPLTGTVEDVSRLVDTRARLGEVRIRLNTAEPAAHLVGMEVEVVIAR
jgi:HlyD family secretion protein